MRARKLLRCLVIAVVLFSGHQVADAQDPAFDVDVKPLLNDYCFTCHGPDRQKGDRRFDMLDGTITDSNSVVEYQDILDQLNLSQMPPEDEKQPADSERRAAVSWLTRSTSDYHATHGSSAETRVLRRLNSREYRNTVRDLLHLNTTMFHPEETFPRDQVSEQLDNVGGALVTSGYLLAQYLNSADRVIEKAITPIRKPRVQTWSFRRNFRQQPEIDQVHGKTNGFSHITLYDVKGADKPEGAYGPILAFKQGVPMDGIYEIRLKAEAVNRLHPYDPKFLGTDPDEPLRLGIVAGNVRVGPLHKQQPIEPQLAEFELTDEPQWYTARVWLDRGYTPRFTFINGLMDVRGVWSRLIRKYPDQFPRRRKPGIVANRFDAIKLGKLPQIHIHEVEITGPFHDQWPTPGQRAMLGEDWEDAANGVELTTAQLREHLTRFASRAYRRPATDGDIDQVMRVIQSRREDGRSLLEAYGDGLKMILCSPNFLYLEPAADGELSAWALASRLSYFLWSSTPDDKLLALARDDSLLRPDELAAQVDRMLDDQRSDAFIDGFLDSWLGFRNLGSMPPDRDRFQEFYHYDLGTAMRRETSLFVRHLIAENLSINNCLESDFTFVNRPLARLYGVSVPASSEFEMVKLKNGRRGGLLGQASVLTVTANGIDTSPVVRGVWLLENILGDPPSPPPPDVEPLDPDIRGATSIRDQLDKHRKVASCAECHRKIDPMGFALEHFNPIGGWRETYRGKVRIDASGEMPDGRKYDSVDEFKHILMTRRDQFARALTTRLLAYAVGRHTVPADRPHIDDIVEQLSRNGYGFRDLIRQIVKSKPFRGAGVDNCLKKDHS
jgi:Protein of unknown function (DUF1592)/Protein of unknown function (DUF1588)/Protein of unknown function (DUF1585)/Protein of unknown function (DUF1595)/Protein of unknown function (DUF1587)/Planctomycete cytochrome C